MDLPPLDGVAEGPDDRLLADDLGEGAWAVTAVEGLLGGGRLPVLGLGGHLGFESIQGRARGEPVWEAQGIPWGVVRGSSSSMWAGRVIAPVTIAGGAVLLRVIGGVGFANYDTLYALAWGGQIARGSTPSYDLPVAPTPHPLVELLGVILSPLSPRGIEDVTVWLGFLALSGCGWVVYRLGSEWFGRAAGALAALLLLTRVPILSYGVRAYVDVPYLLLVLGALLVESRHRRAGAPVLALLALAGLLRPEAWAFSGLYWLYIVLSDAGGFRSQPTRGGGSQGAQSRLVGPGGPFLSEHSRGGRTYGRSRGELIGLTLLAAAAPLIWVISDLVVTGDAVWSLTNTRQTAETLHRAKGIGDVPEYIPKRIGEVLGAPVLAAAVIGGITTLGWLRSRALMGASVGVVAVIVFALFASVGLPIDTRYAFLASAILIVFAGAGVFGWLALEGGDSRRIPWMAVGGLLAIAILAFGPSEYHTIHHELNKLSRQEEIENELVALVSDHEINLSCGPVGVPNHAPVPLLALYLKTTPGNVLNGEAVHLERRPISRGIYVDPASREVEEDFVLDVRDPHIKVGVPPGFSPAGGDRSWRIYRRCEG